MKTVQNAVANGSSALPRTVLSNQIKEIIINEIISGELKPGQRIIENSLTRRLDVSQAPVREALRELVVMGFLESIPYKGTTVRSFSQEELCEVYLVRAALESLGARLAAARITSDDQKTLQDILDRMVDEARRGALRETARLNTEFHETILIISGNKMLHNLWKSMQFGYWTLLTTIMSGQDLEALAHRHEAVLEALMSKDPEKARQAMQHHLEEFGHLIEGPAQRKDAETEVV